MSFFKKIQIRIDNSKELRYLIAPIFSLIAICIIYVDII